MFLISSPRLKQQGISNHNTWPTYKSPIGWSQNGKFHLDFYASNLEESQLVCVSICQKKVELLESTYMFLNNAMDFCREMEMSDFWLVFRQIWQTTVRGSKYLSKCYKPFGVRISEKLIVIL